MSEKSQTFDLIVIGAGPGGYVAAIRAAQLGLKVACIDKHEALGGTCLRVGCIPSKALLESSEQFEHAGHHLAAHGVKLNGDVQLDLAAMIQRKDKIVQTMTGGIRALFKKNKITAIQGHASFTEEGEVRVTNGENDKNGQTLNADHVIIATGSRPATINGVDLDDDRVDTSETALSYDKVPKRLAVIGGGYIGLELGNVWRRLGSEVTVVEYLDRILPGMEKRLAQEAQKIFEKQGMSFRLKSRVTAVKSTKKGVTVELEGDEPVRADRCLVAVGRAPHTEGLGLENIGVKIDDRGCIPVDDDFRTSIEGVYAIGDVIPTVMLAHVAEEEGIACVEKIVTGHGHVNYDAIPAIVYTQPEIATVGKTESVLLDEGHEYVTGEFPFKANGRAHALNDTTGLVKIIADKKTDRVLGVHIIGPRAGDLIAECATAIEFGASSEDIARACHAHPTLSEAVKEAALAVAKRAIHI